MKIILILLSTFMFLNATEMGLKGGSCTLTQEGKVTLIYNSQVYKDVSYKAHAKSGKNFREIFIGSIMSVDKGVKLELLDYKPNKRIKGKPKTGIFLVETTLNNTKESLQMAYIFDKGVMSAIGVTQDATISFNTKVAYSLCHIPSK